MFHQISRNFLSIVEHEWAIDRLLQNPIFAIAHLLHQKCLYNRQEYQLKQKLQSHEWMKVLMQCILIIEVVE